MTTTLTQGARFGRQSLTDWAYGSDEDCERWADCVGECFETLAEANLGAPITLLQDTGEVIGDASRAWPDDLIDTLQKCMERAIVTIEAGIIAADTTDTATIDARGCTDCSASNAFDDWELWEGTWLCVDCVDKRTFRVPLGQCIED